MSEDSAIGVRVLRLLDEHGTLGYDQVAAQLEARPDEVRNTLNRPRGLWFVDALTIGETEAHDTRAVTYWRLTS